MKKENLFKGIIVLAGTGLTYLKYNLNKYLDVDYIMFVIICLILIMLLAIYLLNKKVFGLKTIVINPRVISLLSGSKTAILNTTFKDEADTIKHQKTKDLKFLKPILLFLGACSFGVILGFYYKEPSAKMLRNALSKQSEWKKDLFLDWVKAKTTFFQLDGKGYGDFEFNWLAFSIGAISVLLVYVIIKKTTLVNVLKSKINHYLK